MSTEPIKKIGLEVVEKLKKENDFFESLGRAIMGQRVDNEYMKANLGIDENTKPKERKK